MGEIFEVCEVCQRRFKTSDYDGACSKECAEKDQAKLGGTFEKCPHCGKLHLSVKRHLCDL